MPAKALPIGILGGGGILGAHAPGYLACPELAKVIAVAEPDTSRHARIHQLLGPGVTIYPDYAALLAKAPVAAVDIILPHHLHLPATLAAATKGLPILVEKVMARNLHECDQMLAACAAAKVSLTVCHDRRYDGAWMALHEVVQSGLLGRQYHWRLDHNQNVVFPPDAWVRQRACLGGGAIMSCLTHQIDALRWYAGEISAITCMTEVVPQRMEGEAIGCILARLANGAMAELSINWMTRSHQGPHALWYERVQVVAEQGEAYYQSGKGTFVMLYDPPAGGVPWSLAGPLVAGQFQQVRAGDWRGHSRCIREWLLSLHGQPAAVSTSGAACRGTVEVAEAAYRAEASGQVVKLPITPRPWGAP